MISIITPVLNGRKFIEKNIRAIASLDIPFEHIVVDGGSDDGTLEILKKYEHLIIVNQKEKTGMYGAIHEGFNIAKGKYLSYVNCDDLVEKKGFEDMYKYIENHNLDLVYSDAIEHYIHENRKVKIKGNKYGKYFLTNGYMPFVQPSSIYTKQIYNKVGGLRYDMFKIIGDLDFFKRIAALPESSMKYLPTTSSVFLKYGDSLGDRNTHIQQEELAKINTKINFSKIAKSEI